MQRRQAGIVVGELHLDLRPFRKLLGRWSMHRVEIGSPAYQRFFLENQELAFATDCFGRSEGAFRRKALLPLLFFAHDGQGDSLTDRLRLPAVAIDENFAAE